MVYCTRMPRLNHDNLKKQFNTKWNSCSEKPLGLSELLICLLTTLIIIKDGWALSRFSAMEKVFLQSQQSSSFRAYLMLFCRHQPHTAPPCRRKLLAHLGKRCQMSKCETCFLSSTRSRLVLPRTLLRQSIV